MERYRDDIITVLENSEAAEIQIESTSIIGTDLKWLRVIGYGDDYVKVDAHQWLPLIIPIYQIRAIRAS